MRIFINNYFATNLKQCFLLMAYRKVSVEKDEQYQVFFETLSMRRLDMKAPEKKDKTKSKNSIATQEFLFNKLSVK